MELDVDVLGSGLHLRQPHQLKRAGVVLEHFAVYFALLGQNGKLACAGALRTSGSLANGMASLSV